MRRYIISALISCVFLVPAALAKNYVDVDPDLIYRSKESRLGHLEHVGFYASAMQHWNFTEELAPYTTLTWIHTGNFDNILSRLRQARDADVDVVLSVQPLVFDADYLVKDDYFAKLSSLAEQIELEGLMNQIVMVYVIDEPYLHAGDSKLTTRQEMYEQLLVINKEIKQLFRQKPLGVIFYHKEVFRQTFKIPKSYNWIGFDCYKSLYDCNGKPFTSYYNELLTHMVPKQRLMAVPEAWIRYRDLEQGRFEPPELWQLRKNRMIRNLRKRLSHHYEIALSEPRFVAFIPFLWSMEAPEGKPENAGFGVDRFDEQFPNGGQKFVDLLEDIVTQIKEEEQVYPNMSHSQTEAHLRRPPNAYAGQVLDLSEDGLVSAWSVNRALPHKNLRMQVAVYHQGAELYASGVKRSFILDDSLSKPKYIGQPVVGLHGYRQQLPRWLLDSLQGETAVLELRIYPDRAPLVDYHAEEYEVEF